MRIKWFVAKALKYALNPPALNRSIVAKHGKVCPGCEVNGTTIDEYSYVGSFCFLLNAKIGKFCSIGDRCRIGGAEHTISAVSTSPVFFEGKNVLRTNFADQKEAKTLDTVIENDVWIGAYSLIKSGVTIHNGAVVGMGSVVTHDIPPYEIWAGNPARFIRKRFDDETIEKLLQIKWWNWDDDRIEKFAPYFDDPKRLFAKIEEEKFSGQCEKSEND